MSAARAKSAAKSRRHAGDTHREGEAPAEPLSAANAGSAGASPSRIDVPTPWLDRTLFAAVLVWMFVACIFPLVDTDIWWHLRTGELILEKGELPQVDWFTFTDYDKRWIDLHWGFQLLVTFLYRAGGTDAIILFKAATITLAVGIAWLAAGRNVAAWLKAAVWLMPAIAVSGRAYERPEVLTQLFLATWLWILHRLPNRPGLIWLLPLVQVIWVNCHSLFVLGLVVGGCWIVDRIARTWLGGQFGLSPAETNPPAILCQVVGLLIVLASFVNPYFEEGALFPLEVYRKLTADQALYASIGEFQQPIDFVRESGFGWEQFKKREGFWNVYLQAELWIWIVAAASFVLLAKRRRWSLFRLLLFAGFSHLAWKASRNTNIFSIVSIVVTLANLEDWRALGPLTSREKTSPPEWRGGATRLTAAMLVAWCGLIVAVIAGPWHWLGAENKSFGLGQREAWFIHDAAKFAAKPGLPLRAFVSNIGQAAVYSYHNGPERRIFMDGRLEVCTPQTWVMYNTILQAMAVGDFRWQDAVRDAEGQLPVVILDSRVSRPQINGLLNTPGWRLVFADGSAGVFVDEKLATTLSLPPADFEPLKFPPGTRPH
jgi:hypothetical protein